MLCKSLDTVPAPIFSIISDYIDLRDLHMLSMTSSTIRQSCTRLWKYKILYAFIYAKYDIIPEKCDLAKCINKIYCDCNLCAVRQSNNKYCKHQYAILHSIAKYLVAHYSVARIAPMLMHIGGFVDELRYIDNSIIYQHAPNIEIIRYIRERSEAKLLEKILAYKRYDLLNGINFNSKTIHLSQQVITDILNLQLSNTRLIRKSCDKSKSNRYVEPRIIKYILRRAIIEARIDTIITVMQKYNTNTMRSSYMYQLATYGSYDLGIQLRDRGYLYPIRRINLMHLHPIVMLIDCPRIIIRKYYDTISTVHICNKSDYGKIKRIIVDSARYMLGAYQLSLDLSRLNTDLQHSLIDSIRRIKPNLYKIQYLIDNNLHNDYLRGTIIDVYGIGLLQVLYYNYRYLNQNKFKEYFG